MERDVLVGALGTAWVVGLCITMLVLWAVRRWQRLVIPSARDAHTIPMPAGGGLGIIAGFVAGHIVAGISFSAYWWGAMGCILVAFGDDVVRPFSVVEKTLLIVIATVVLLADPAWYGGEYTGNLASVYTIFLLMFGLTWFFGLCNVFNFMDGIDGLSVTQSMLIAGWIAVYVTPSNEMLANQLWIFVASLAGFLVLNRPPARIFMGDIGALFCGFVVAAFSLMAVRENVWPGYIVLLLSYYLFDTSYTLVRRLINGENPIRAHNKHLYQRLVRMGWSHGQVNLWAGCMTLANGMGVYCDMVGLPVVAMVCWGISAVALFASVLIVERRVPSFV